MKKLGYALAAVATFAIAAPTLASAETVIIKKRDRGHHFHDSRADFHRDRGWHRHRGADKVVIIKKQRRGWD